MILSHLFFFPLFMLPNSLCSFLMMCAWSIFAPFIKHTNNCSSLSFKLKIKQVLLNMEAKRKISWWTHQAIWRRKKWKRWNLHETPRITQDGQDSQCYQARHVMNKWINKFAKNVQKFSYSLVLSYTQFKPPYLWLGRIQWDKCYQMDLIKLSD